MPIPSEFPTTADLERVKREFELYCLYACKDIDPDKTSDRWKFRLREFFDSDEQKAKLLDICLHVAPVVIESGTDFLFGEQPKIEIVGQNDTDPKVLQDKANEIIERTDLIRKLSENCDLTQAVGHGHFKIYAEDNEAYIQEVPYSTFYPEWDRVPMGEESTNPRIACYITVNEAGITKRYIYVEDYYMEGEKCVIAYSLFEDVNGKIGNQVPLAKLKLDEGKAGTIDAKGTLIQQTELDEIPVVSINLRKTALERYGRSVLERVKPLLHELNDRLTQLSLQFLKHLNAKLQIPDGSIERNKDGSVKSTKLEVILAKAGDPDAKYITNENPLIEQAFTHIEKIIRKICKITATPDSFLTEDDKGGVEKTEALKVRLMQFLKREKSLQTTYQQAIKKIMLLALKAEGQKTDNIDVKVTFDPGLPKDWEVDVRVWGDALAQGLASKDTAIGMFQGIADDALEEELARIDAEEQAKQQSLLAQVDANMGGGQETATVTAS